MVSKFNAQTIMKLVLNNTAGKSSACLTLNVHKRDESDFVSSNYMYDLPLVDLPDCLIFSANDDLIANPFGSMVDEKSKLRFNFTNKMSPVLRKPVFGVSDQVRHKPGCTATQDG